MLYLGYWAVDNLVLVETGMVLFLEEDHYVVEDFIQVLKLAQDLCQQRHPDCGFVALGDHGDHPGQPAKVGL